MLGLKGGGFSGLAHVHSALTTQFFCCSVGFDELCLALSLLFKEALLEVTDSGRGILILRLGILGQVWSTSGWLLHPGLEAPSPDLRSLAYHGAPGLLVEVAKPVKLTSLWLLRAHDLVHLLFFLTFT